MIKTRTGLRYESEPNFSSWQECLAYLEGLRDAGWVYRGQANYAWTLVTSLERDLAAIHVSGADSLIFEAEAINYFKHPAKGLV